MPVRRSPPSAVLLIGDTLDDAIAPLGVRVVLLSDGAFDRAEVVATLGGGTVLAESLSNALRAGPVR
ncbi:hypothetical protein [Streptomyces tendae]|uniref:hypothetical protein n=1 Tax=Streptomyces tendae TaxID=1932 RepID=UPI0036D025AE